MTQASYLGLVKCFLDRYVSYKKVVSKQRIQGPAIYLTLRKIKNLSSEVMTTNLYVLAERSLKEYSEGRVALDDDESFTGNKVTKRKS